MKKIAFVGGQMCPEMMPIQELSEAARIALERDGRSLISYPFQVDMHQNLIRVSARRYEHREGKPLPAEEIMITTGSKQGIWSVMEYFTKPGDTILCEDWTYVGTIGMFRTFGRRMEGIPLDRDGMRVDLLEERIESLIRQGRGPKLIYTIPAHQNPTGAIMSRERRERLVSLALRYEIPVMEDDCYGDVIFDNEPLPPSLHALSDSPLLFYLGSYSKILGPGFRLGYLAARPPHHEKLLGLKNISDGGTSALSSLIVAEYLQGRLWEHIRQNNERIHMKQELVCSRLREELDGCGVSWEKPRGGIFLWIRLPEALDLALLASLCAQRGVEYTPGRDFSVREENIPYIRLSYAHLTMEEIKDGIGILARCIRDCCKMRNDPLRIVEA